MIILEELVLWEMDYEVIDDTGRKADELIDAMSIRW